MYVIQLPLGASHNKKGLDYAAVWEEANGLKKG